MVLRPMNETLPLLRLDDHLVAVHKPPGLLVHRTPLAAHEERFAMQMVRNQLGRHVYPVHRLDRGTSGVLLLALDPDTARRLAAQFEAQQTRKTYIGFVRGWPAEAGVIDRALGRIEEDLPRTDRGIASVPQAALTRWRRLGRIELDSPIGPHPTCRYALLELLPETGRQHQIRRHLKQASHPLIGDATYGKGVHNRWWAERLRVARLWLHAGSLELEHPVTREPLCLQAPLGPDWDGLLRETGWQWDAEVLLPR